MAEFLGCHSVFFLEQPSEIGYVVESAVETNLGDCHRCVEYQPGSVPKAVFNNIFGKSSSCGLFEKMAQSGGGHRHEG